MRKITTLIRRLVDAVVIARDNTVYKSLCKNVFTVGTGILKVGKRKWFNPLRYIKGTHYRKNVRLEDVFK